MDRDRRPLPGGEESLRLQVRKGALARLDRDRQDRSRDSREPDEILAPIDTGSARPEASDPVRPSAVPCGAMRIIGESPIDPLKADS